MAKLFLIAACIGCRVSLHVASCDECSTMDDISFHTGAAVNEGEEAECEARVRSIMIMRFA